LQQQLKLFSKKNMANLEARVAALERQMAMLLEHTKDPDLFFCIAELECDEKKSFELHKTAAEKGSAKSEYQLGVRFENGTAYDAGHFLADLHEAVYWYDRAATHGLDIAAVRIRVLAETGLPVAKYAVGLGHERKNEEGEALLWFRKAAVLDEPLAQFAVGMYFWCGKGVTVNKVVAMLWLEKAAKSALPEVKRSADTLSLTLSADEMFSLGKEYKKLRMDEDAFRWFRASAKRYHTDAQYELGRCYHDGEGVHRNFEQALFFFQQAAVQGNPLAQCALANMHKAGRGCTANAERAFRWYKKAADGGFFPAYTHVGQMYAQGDGVKLNADSAAYWIKKAAEN